MKIIQMMTCTMTTITFKEVSTMNIDNAMEILNELEVAISSQLAEDEIDICLIMEKLQNTWNSRGEGDSMFNYHMIAFSNELLGRVESMIDRRTKEERVLQAMYDLTGREDYLR